MAQTAEATSPKGAARKICSISTVRCGHRTLRRGSIKAYFVGVDDHIDPRLQGTNQGLGYTLTWQNGRQLASMKFGAINIGFTYDVDGLRTSKTVFGVEHKYYYVGNRLQYEKIGSSQELWYFYDADGTPSGIRYKDNSGTVNDYYFVCNWRGDVVQIYNAAGELVTTYDYDAWGRVTENATSADTQNITDTNPIRYRGYYYDTETRLYYVNSRYYDPAVKRFVSSDDSIFTAATPGALTDKNSFAYCDNNPVSRVDDEGTMWHIVVGAVIGGVLNSLSDIKGLVNAYRSDGNVYQAWAHFGISFITGAVSGGLAMTGMGAFTSSGVNAVLSGGGELLHQITDYHCEGKEIDYTSIAYETLVGAVTSFEKGAGSKSATDLGKGTVKKTYKTFKAVWQKKNLKAAVSAYKGKAVQQARYYLRSTRKMTGKLVLNVAQGYLYNKVSSSYKKLLYKIRRRFN